MPEESGFEVFQRPRKPKSTPAPAGKSAAEVWDEAVAAVARHLETGVIHYTWNGNARRPNNYRAAAADAMTTPNPYTADDVSIPPARISPEWKALVSSAENLGTALALFQNAKDDFVAIYPKDKQ
ncbi:MAG TPA: hypothetical protein DDY41_06995 [Arthrobacter bacterium]|jgi:hypothetical protein|nr:hypothetical protein [Arthrobacter sp.]